MRVYQHTLSDDVLRLVERIKPHLEILGSFPEEGIEITDEQLEMVVGGVLSAEDMAYCQQAVEYYRSRGYTLEQLTKEMGDYQNSLRAEGETDLAERSAEYLEYMTSIW